MLLVASVRHCLQLSSSPYWQPEQPCCGDGLVLLAGNWHRPRAVWQAKLFARAKVLRLLAVLRPRAIWQAKLFAAAKLLRLLTVPLEAAARSATAGSPAAASNECTEQLCWGKQLGLLAGTGHSHLAGAAACSSTAGLRRCLLEAVRPAAGTSSKSFCSSSLSSLAKADSLPCWLAGGTGHVSFGMGSSLLQQSCSGWFQCGCVLTLHQ